MIEESFSLTDIERRQQLWLKLKKHFEQRVADLHGKLEGEQTEHQTAALRGQIRAFKEVLRLGDEPPLIDG